MSGFKNELKQLLDKYKDVMLSSEGLDAVVEALDDVGCAIDDDYYLVLGDHQSTLYFAADGDDQEAEEIEKELKEKEGNKPLNDKTLAGESSEQEKVAAAAAEKEKSAGTAAEKAKDIPVLSQKDKKVQFRRELMYKAAAASRIRQQNAKKAETGGAKKRKSSGGEGPLKKRLLARGDCETVDKRDFSSEDDNESEKADELASLRSEIVTMWDEYDFCNGLGILEPEQEAALRDSPLFQEVDQLVRELKEVVEKKVVVDDGGERVGEVLEHLASVKMSFEVLRYTQVGEALGKLRLLKEPHRGLRNAIMAQVFKLYDKCMQAIVTGKFESEETEGEVDVTTIVLIKEPSLAENAEKPHDMQTSTEMVLFEGVNKNDVLSRMAPMFSDKWSQENKKVTAGLHKHGGNGIRDAFNKMEQGVFKVDETYKLCNALKGNVIGAKVMERIGYMFLYMASQLEEHKFVEYCQEHKDHKDEINKYVKLGNRFYQMMTVMGSSVLLLTDCVPMTAVNKTSFADFDKFMNDIRVVKGIDRLMCKDVDESEAKDLESWRAFLVQFVRRALDRNLPEMEGWVLKNK